MVTVGSGISDCYVKNSESRTRRDGWDGNEDAASIDWDGNGTEKRTQLVLMVTVGSRISECYVENSESRTRRDG